MREEKENCISDICTDPSEERMIRSDFPLNMEVRDNRRTERIALIMMLVAALASVRAISNLDGWKTLRNLFSNKSAEVIDGKRTKKDPIKPQFESDPLAGLTKKK